MWNIRSHACRFPVHTGTLTPSIAHPNRFLNHLKRFSAGFLTFRVGKIKKHMVLGAESTIWNARREAGQPSQSSPVGLASSPKGRALGMTAKFPGRPQRLRVRLLPLGGAVAQRLRGFQSAEPEKTVKRSSRRTGVNLQLFPAGAHFFRIVKGEQPLSNGLRPPASASCLGRHSRLAGRCPNNSSLFPPLAAVVVVALRGGWSPEVGRGESEHPSLPLAQRSVFVH